MIQRYLNSLFISGAVSGIALTITNSIMFERFSKLESNTLYLGRDVPGQIGGLFFSLLLNKLSHNHRNIGLITAISLPICVYLESRVENCPEEHIFPTIIASSFLKSLAFTGPVGAHSVALVTCSKSSSIASFGVKTTIASSLGATSGITIGLSIKEYYSEHRFVLGIFSALLYPIVLYFGWRRIM